MHIFDARIAAITAATPSIRVLRLTISDPAFRFLPGQWVDLSVDADGTTWTSGYSITTSPIHRGEIELAIKASGRHPLSRWVHERAAVGDRVRVSQGQGPFVYLPEMSDNVVLIGGGVGITPLLSIFRHVRDAGLPTRAHLVYSVSDSREILFRDELDAAARTHPNLHVSVTVTQPDPAWHGLTGRIDPVKLHALDAPDDTLYYLCGPRGMVEDLSVLLHELGVPMSRIIFEKWW
ncbi:ferredoxin--NADP reductase [Thiobacillus sedimenti]|uniref:FAD-dependent oxidoreductase n=1 Tax=Thiobacillus sedimenti TaxID=3110231 RepID=A0ABZ1CFW8_9PROT|nr:FAD-dependent oxidoreductase [Thiobacillus sp. SCUT-2]WRS37928.1 FAD-dependent oxidoreductase [Thiobacillus sp. SCUT-2]